MKRLLFFLLAFTTLTSRGQDMQRVRQTIAHLASPELHGRGYAFKGDSLAAGYLQKQYTSIGLKPFGGSYLQHFTLPVNILDKQVSLKVEGTALINGVDFLAHAASAAGKGSGFVYPIDTLLLQDADEAEAFLSQNLRKQVLVVRQRHFHDLMNLPEPFKKNLQKAAGVIVLQPGNKVMATVRSFQYPVPVLEVLEKSWPATASKVEFLVDARLDRNYRSQNVIGFLPGTTKPDSFLVVTAHYDHVGRMGKDLLFPGAHDNASGTAMLLELAHYYAQPQNRPAYSIAFMAFAAEEAGLVGSEFYTENPLFTLSNIKMLLNLDLMSTGEEGMMVVNGSVFTQQFNLLQQLNQQHQFLPALKVRGKAPNSDHYYFSEKGVPAFFFYTLGGTTTEYHHPKDTAGTLPLTKFKEVMGLIQAFFKAI